MPRPKDKTVATTAADADTFLIDGATGVRAMPKTALVSDLANSLPTVTRSARGLVPASGGTSGTTRFFREDLTFATPPAGEGGGSGVVDRFDDRAAIAAAGSISLDVDVVETRSFDASDSTRLGWGRGQYVRTSVPSSEMQTNPGYIHATGDANVSGGSWWRLLTDGGRHLASQFGAKGNGSWQSQNVGTNDYAAIKAAQAFIYAHQTSSGGAPSLHFETGVYRIFDPAPTTVNNHVTFDLWGGRFNWTGEGAGQFGLHSSVLFFTDPTKYGFVVQTNSTVQSQATTGRPAGQGGDGTIFQNLEIRCASVLTHNYMPTADGVLFRGRGSAENCKFMGWPRDGFHCAGNSGEHPSGNANCTYARNCMAYWNGRHGFHFDGADGNAGGCCMCDSSDNGQFGFYDPSFLGNTFTHNHTSGNGISFYSYGNADGISCGSIVNHSDGKSYFAIEGQTQETYRTTTPGTNSVVWEMYVPNHVSYGRTWDPNNGTTYAAGGSYCASNPNSYSCIIGNYAEGAQAPAQFNGFKVEARGNALGDNISNHSNAPNEFHGIRKNVPYKVEIKYENDPVTTVSIGGLKGTGDMLTFTNSTWGGQHLLFANSGPGGPAMSYFGGDLNGKPYFWITTPNTTVADGSGVSGSAKGMFLTDALGLGSFDPRRLLSAARNSAMPVGAGDW